MTDRSNPKTYYNESAYSEAPKVSKPDDVAYPPPPPYSQPGTSSSSAYSPSVPSAPPSTYATAQDYPNYGSLDPNRPGLLDPHGSSPYSPPPNQPQQPYPQRNIPDVGSPALSNSSNPHLPRDWVPDNGYNKSAPSSPPQQQQQQPGEPTSRISIPGFTRQRLDNDDDPGCCKKWCKYIFVAILVWLVILKYNDNFQWGGDHDSSHHIGFWQCKGQSLVQWDDIPSRIPLEQDLYLAFEGPVTVSGSYINIHPSGDRDEGWIESHINIAPPSLVDSSELSYRLEKQDDETRLVLHFPPWDWKHGGTHDRPCVQVKMDIYLPDKVKSLRTSVNNIPIHVTDGNNNGLSVNHGDGLTLETDRVELITTNAAIIFDTPRWEGDTLALTTTNGEIKIAAVMEAGDWLRVQSSNGNLISTNTLTAKDKLEMITTNGKISTQSLIVKDVLHVSTTNAAINLESRVSAEQLLIESTNAQLELRELSAESSLTASTSNAQINARVVAEKDPRVRFSTKNAPVNIQMTKEYEGQLLAKTSRQNKVVIDDSNITYDTNQRHYKQGRRLKGDGDLTVETSNSDIRLSFNV
ncbi:hypothetical protein BCR42DRAFT_411812 [Absidia repens]|uniref:Uncharacterized protein n=1 Tax=Absidia repens TaxID=90262 RepID=A0A1X2IMA0_9FUNG|nr:hypothetical protein BCR42DRAFT_411812 [Absidia repens]